jgi:hypothetical protein
MSALYRSYEQDFTKYLNSIKRRTALIHSLPKGKVQAAQKALTIAEALGDAGEADKCV